MESVLWSVIVVFLWYLEAFRLLCGVFKCRGLGAGLAVLTATSENTVVSKEVPV